MKLKISSDGTHAGTKVFNAETGEQLGMVQKVRLSIEPSTPMVSGYVVIAGQEFVVTNDFVSSRKVITEFLSKAHKQLENTNIDEAALLEKLEELAANYGG